MKLLSRPGKEVLIKAVAQAIPTYMMSIFRIPDGLIDEIHNILCRFWWGSTDARKKLHWQNWLSLCSPKSMGGLGFRDLKCFNQALLAKQVWRLQTSPHTLLFQILKARYFNRISVLEANRGYDPSYSWRSLWGSKGLLRDGIAWKVGDGRDIRIWRDPWLIKDGKPAVLTPPNGDDPERTVAELLSANCDEWDVGRVTNLMGAENVAAVLSLPLSEYDRRDGIFWWPTKNGIYSVKSGYWLARHGVEMVNNNLFSDSWRKIWKLRGPPKLRHFLWNALKENLAVKLRLFQKYILADSTCPVCGNATESVIHTLFHCCHAKSIWEHSGLEELIEEAPADSIAAKWSWLCGRLQEHELLRVAALMWAAWRCRNVEVFEGIKPNAVMLAMGFCRLVEDYQTYAQKVFLQPTNVQCSSSSSWMPPQPGVIKLNVDAHIAAGGIAGIGTVFRDHHGNIILTATKRLYQSSPEIAEAQAIKFALKIAGQFGYQRVWVESDALNVISAISSHSTGAAPIFNVYADILEDRARFTSCLFSHIKRSGNTVAHLVAREDTGECLEVVRCNAFPQSVVTLSHLDITT